MNPPLLKVGPLNYKGIMKIDLIAKIPINETQLNEMKPVYIEISKPLKFTSKGNFGPPYYENTTRL